MSERPADNLPALIKPNARDELIQAINQQEEKIAKADLAKKTVAKSKKFRNAFIQLSEEHCHFSEKQLRSFSQQHLVELDKIVATKALQNIIKGIGILFVVFGPVILGLILMIIFMHPIFFFCGGIVTLVNMGLGSTYNWSSPSSLDFTYLKLRKRHLPRLLENLNKKTKKLTAG